VKVLLTRTRLGYTFTSDGRHDRITRDEVQINLNNGHIRWRHFVTTLYNGNVICAVTRWSHHRTNIYAAERQVTLHLKRGYWYPHDQKPHRLKHGRHFLEV
jgi:hypothetical protein